MTDETGKQVWSAEYTPFGKQVSKEGEMDRVTQFTGKDLDEDTGLYYFNARWMDPELGRFITEDSENDPNNPNLYVYVANNPLLYSDPTGHFADETNVFTDPYGEKHDIGDMGTVENTDTLDSIAESHYENPELKSIIIAANGLDPDNPEIKPGQVLFIPTLEKILDEKGKVKDYAFVSLFDPKNPEASTRMISGLYEIARRNNTDVWIRAKDSGGAQTDITTPLIALGGIYSLTSKTVATFGMAAYKAGADFLLKASVTASIWGQKALDKASQFFGRFTRNVPIDKLRMNPEDPFNFDKLNYNASALSGYRNYIAQHGTIPKPILVKKVGDAYMIVNGHHRYWAALQMGLKNVPIKVE